jgi:hypothetical protein
LYNSLGIVDLLYFPPHFDAGGGERGQYRKRNAKWAFLLDNI